jgi:hypothetical protein
MGREDDSDEDTEENSGGGEDGNRAHQVAKATAGTSHKGTKGKKNLILSYSEAGPRSRRAPASSPEADGRGPGGVGRKGLGGFPSERRKEEQALFIPLRTLRASLLSC